MCFVSPACHRVLLLCAPMQAIHGMHSSIEPKARVYLSSRGAWPNVPNEFMHHCLLLNKRPLARSSKSETGRKKNKTPADLESDTMARSTPGQIRRIAFHRCCILA
ncbi:hypothetical protein GGI43DRAFT_168558 [Trichoderma evansii]